MHAPSQHNLRVALYARVSTDEQREGQTIQSQLHELNRFADQKGWLVADTYKDDGWSGALLERPELDRLRDDASRALFEAVLINDVDRLARDVTHLGVIKRDLELRGVSIIFRKLPAEDTPTNNLLVNILGSFAEFERELIADRTRRGRRHKVETRQLFLGCLAPYGFRYLPKRLSPSATGDLALVPEEADLVRMIYRWVDLEGLSARQVVRRLNQEGIAPRKRGDSWQKSSVLRILRSEVYAGTWHYNKHSKSPSRKGASGGSRPGVSMRLRPKQEWIPLALPEHLRVVDRALWHRVQRRLDQNRAFSLRNSKHAYLLRGLVRCGGCSSAYVGDPSHGRYYYRCAARCRTLPTIKEETIDDAVWTATTELLLKPDLLLEKLQALLKRQASTYDARTTARHQRSKLAMQISAEEERLLEAYRLGLLYPAALARELEKLAARRSTLDSGTSDTLNDATPRPTLIVESAAQFLRLVANRLGDLRFEERQTLLRRLITSIVFEGDLLRIQGHIPTSGSSSSPVHPSPNLQPSSTQTQNDGDNDQSPVLENRSHGLTAGRISSIALELHGRNPAESVTFELLAPVTSKAARKVAA